MHARDDQQVDRPSVCDCTYRIRPLGVEIAIGCTAALRVRLEGLLSRWSPRATDHPAPSEVWISDPAGAASPGVWTLGAGQTTLFETGSAAGVLQALQHWIDATVSRRAVGLMPLHAGVVAWHDRALLLPGPSGSGKSTLVAALAACGATYYSDELAFLDATGRAHAYPRHMILRDGASARLVTPPDDLRSMPRAPLQVGLICALRFESGRRFEVDPIPASEAVLLMLANTPRELTVSDGIPSAFVQAAAAGLAYRGVRDGADEAAASILRLADATARSR